MSLTPPLWVGSDGVVVLPDDHDAGADGSFGLLGTEGRDGCRACGVVSSDELVDVRAGGDIELCAEDLHSQRHVGARVGHDVLVAVGPVALCLEALGELQNLFEDVTNRFDGDAVQHDDLAADIFGHYHLPELRCLRVLLGDPPEPQHDRSCLECQLRVGDVLERQIWTQPLVEPFSSSDCDFPKWFRHEPAP